jgi:hypothetical protein
MHRLQVVLARRPVGEPRESDFRLVEIGKQLVKLA